MKTNCACLEKSEEWHFERQLGCWYAIRECTSCKYYWEGPDHSKTNILFPPITGTVNRSIDNTDPVDSIRDRQGTFHIYCYDEHGQYGSPVKLDEVKDIFEFCQLNKYSHKEIKVMYDDAINISVLDGKYVFPQEWTRFNESEE
ncbi:hypothetical protein L1N85_19515 [Paenibacillus alkaliterrae]|uniref:hypothetical protein n=1 Tax=Paenibacillus alkaliterrae TaxID=320909 RepID=UPI001F392A5B|nr:hypothetical protein [Paenibacillus alkaliterrae]MCF2940585.1 hypothetical protein [Paenibacillus alkaliterrae]